VNDEVLVVAVSTISLWIDCKPLTLQFMLTWKIQLQ
jgi:hypothetical protein